MSTVRSQVTNKKITQVLKNKTSEINTLKAIAGKTSTEKEFTYQANKQDQSDNQVFFL